MKKILSIFGTRPEAIKMCPPIRALAATDEFDTVTVLTGQHRDMPAPILAEFGVVEDYDLALMQEGQSLADITAAVLRALPPVLEKEQPDLVLVHGDTSTAFASALCCFYMRFPVAHVEAGLRTYNLLAPFPEEWNRQSITKLADLHFAPTERAKWNLFSDGVREDAVIVTGNTVIDALKTTVKKDFRHELLDRTEESRFILMTAHRRESFGEPMREMFAAIKRILREYPEIKIIYPVHPNPKVRKPAETAFRDEPNMILTEPLDVVTFHNLMARCHFVITDSGGIQEEAPALGKPVLVMREVTERTEGVRAGTLRLIGTEEEKVYREIKELLDDPERYRAMSESVNPYGDGKASERIVDGIRQYFDKPPII